MKEKKYIDRLYQEKFKDFEAAPSEAVWKSISSKLREQEERKKPAAVPLWYRVAGVAAILVFLILLGDWIFPYQNSHSIVNQEELEQDIQDSFSDTKTEVASTVREASEASDDSKTRIIPSKKGISEALNSKKEVASLESLPVAGISTITQRIFSSNLEQNQESPKHEVNNNKSLFDAVKENEEVVIAVPQKKNFELSTHAAPIYYGNFGKGNFLDPKFNRNDSQGEVTYSYGINIAYALSEKVKIRSGVSKVNMSYNTSDVSYHAVAGPIPIAGVDLHVVSNNPQPKEFDPVAVKKPFGSSNRSSVGNLLSGSLNQEMGFIEVPVELEFNIINRRFELNIIGGASTLFLDENQISVSSVDMLATGEANNLNQVSFSTNIGLGLDYNISDKFQLNVEPMLKYQINTFTTPHPDNQPYYLGIYSGFSFKF